MSQLPSEIVSLEDVPDYVNLLVYGDSGSGKSVLAASDDKVLIVNTEPKGTLSAKMMGYKASVWNIKTIADMDKVYDWAAKLVQKGEPIPFNWFVIDSLTEYQNMEMAELLEVGHSRNPHKDEFVPEWKDYLQSQKRILRRVKEFNSLPVNILYTCLAVTHTDPDGEEFVAPALHGKGYGIAMQVAAHMTSYGYLQVKSSTVPVVENGQPVNNPKTGKPKVQLETHRYIYWQDIKSMRGKDRTLALAPYTRDLTLRDIRLRVEKTFASETSSGQASGAGKE